MNQVRKFLASVEIGLIALLMSPVIILMAAFEDVFERGAHE